MAYRSHKVTRILHDDLGQHLVGTLLAAGALKTRLSRRQAPEATEAAYLLDLLKKAHEELGALTVRLDSANPGETAGRPDSAGSSPESRRPPPP